VTALDRKWHQSILQEGREEDRILKENVQAEHPIFLICALILLILLLHSNSSMHVSKTDDHVH
jgi:hypothetical protein